MFKYVHVRCNCEILHHKWFLGTIKCFKGYKNMFLVKSLAVSPYYRLTFMKDLQSVISQKSSQVCASQYIQKFSTYIYIWDFQKIGQTTLLYYTKKWDFSDGFELGDPCWPRPLSVLPILSKKSYVTKFFFIGGRGRGHFF